MYTKALSGLYSGPFFDPVDDTIDAKPGKPCVTFQFTDCICPPYRFNEDGTVEALPQGTDLDCPPCHPKE